MFSTSMMDTFFSFLVLEFLFFSSDLVQAAYIQGLLDSALVGSIERRSQFLLETGFLWKGGCVFIYLQWS
jgi:hypothetical protein